MSRVSLSESGPLLTVTLTRSDGRPNMMDLDTVPELAAAFERAASRPARAVVLAAEGRHFCVGGDHKEVEKMSRAERFEFTASILDLYAAMIRLPTPIVAAAQGAAIGGGVEMLLFCDFVVAAADGVFEMPEARLDIPMFQPVVEAMTERTGWPAARRLLMLGRRIEADEALRVGLIDAVAPRAELEHHAVAMVGELAAVPERSMRRLRPLLVQRERRSAELVEAAAQLRSKGGNR